MFLGGTILGNLISLISNRLNFNEIKQDPVSVLAADVVLTIFSRLNLATLGSSCCVSKAWEHLASRPNLWKIAVYNKAIGNQDWAQCFGADVVKNEDRKEEWFSLPWKEFIEDCKKFKSLFPEKNATDILMLVRLPKTLNGGLTLISLGMLSKKYFPSRDNGFGYVWPAIVDELGDKSIDRSCWVLMTKDVLSGSQGPFGYEVPGVLEAAACNLSQFFFDPKLRLPDRPNTYIRCKERVQDYQIGVGGSPETGLCLDGFRNDKYHDFFRVALVRKF